MEDIINRIPDKYKEDIIRAIEILKEAGCREIFLFGSLVDGEIRDGSDIDLAISGCPAGLYYNILGQLLLQLNHQVDLIDLDNEDGFVKHLKKEGKLVYVS